MNPRPQTFDQAHISKNALEVVAKLQEQGYQAFLVGGCVRDLLLGRHPKDFDVATDARPDQVCALFRRSRIVGRRFRIVHARFGRELVEVTTFRGHHEQRYQENHSPTGMTLKDNIYGGSFKEDAIRRDFTVNALYYQPLTGELLDPMGGEADLAKRRLRTIGQPEERFREDPVRMLRALRFKAKLGFKLAPEVEAAIAQLGHLIQDVPPARLFEEMLKLFMAGFGEQACEGLQSSGLYEWLFPSARERRQPARELARLALASTDSRIAAGLPVTPAFVYAAILWPPFVAERDAAAKTPEAIDAAAESAIRAQQQFISIPRRFSYIIKDIWTLQSRLPERHGQRPDKLLEQRRFRAAYDFLLLREQAESLPGDLGAWWTEYQEADPARRKEMKQPFGQPRRRKRKRRAS